MRVLHLVAADRWTGAAATTLQAVEALRDAGHDVRLAYRPGRNLEERLAGVPWAEAALAKERSPGDLADNVRRVRELAAGCDLLHAHLPHDHLLARLAARRLGARLVRSVHHPGHLRPHLFHRWLFRDCAGVGLANSALRPPALRQTALRSKPVAVLPVALEQRFAPGGSRAAARGRLGIPPDAVVAGTIGKLDPDRGQDLFIRAVAAAPPVWGLVIGKGPHEPGLRALARDLAAADRIVFPGYVEDGLEDLYAAMDLFVFPAAGSDWAHRAIAEAAGCGLPTLAADLPGVTDLVEPGETGDLYPAPDAAALAVLIGGWSRDPDRRHRAGLRAVERATRLWSPAALAAALTDLYAAAAATDRAA